MALPTFAFVPGGPELLIILLILAMFVVPIVVLVIALSVYRGSKGGTTADEQARRRIEELEREVESLKREREE